MYRKTVDRIEFVYRKSLTQVLRYRYDGSDSRDDIKTILSESEDVTIYFLCHGNICRSPFAERYLNNVVDSNITASSAGFYSQPNRTSPLNAIEAATAYNVDLTSHQSAVVDEPTVAKADLIFVMDYENLYRFTQEFPEEREKVFLIGEVTNTDKIHISDPYGEDPEVFDRAYDEISQIIDELVELNNNEFESQ